MTIKKVIHWVGGGGSGGVWRLRLNFLLEVQLQYLLGYPSNVNTFMPSVGS